jgi:hypothetical protein
MILLISASLVARIAGLSHWHPAFFFPVLGMEPRTWYMLGKDSTTELHPANYFYLS